MVSPNQLSRHLGSGQIRHQDQGRNPANKKETITHHTALIPHNHTIQRMSAIRWRDSSVSKHQSRQRIPAMTSDIIILFLSRAISFHFLPFPFP